MYAAVLHAAAVCVAVHDGGRPQREMFADIPVPDDAFRSADGPLAAALREPLEPTPLSREVCVLEKRRLLHLDEVAV